MTIDEQRRLDQPAIERKAHCGLQFAQAYWVRRDTILCRAVASAAHTFSLHHDPEGRLKIEGNEVAGGDQLPLRFEPGPPDQNIRDKFPHLAGLVQLKIDRQYLPQIANILREQVAISVKDAAGRLILATQLQIPGVLDDLYPYHGPLGVSFEGRRPVLRVWAPTARRVWLHLYSDSRTAAPAQSLAMAWDPTTGVWSAAGEPGWTGMFYLYEVEVFTPLTCRVERNFVTDPYSTSLSTNSRRSQIIDLHDPALMPRGWPQTGAPPLESFVDQVIYELHVRDFSIADRSIPPHLRGTYLAFTRTRSYGMRHLRALARAGLSHVHLLPVFDFATVDEDKRQWVQPPEEVLARYPGDSPEPQKLIAQTKDRDGYNWGYDPFHFTVPEGSYAVNPDGANRILEFREMVQALHQTGLRVIMDVVYNHTYASGLDEKSVLDKIVPGYYHRLNADGLVETSTCCANTASEHAMMEKLMIDSLITWATAYKIDGFRFDLMGHHLLANMVRARQALDRLTLQDDGVDGRKIYLYGEGWDFGEMAGGARGVNAAQRRIGGTGIGAFNDRLRDAARGGRPFGGIQEQGFLTGLYTDPNLTDQGTPDQQKARLLHLSDWIRLSLAGNLKDYRLVNASGRMVSGIDIDYNGQPAAYCEAPQENVVYISAHDNETLFDAIQLKAPPTATLADRLRMHRLGLSLVMFCQGVPFFLAGDELLRSKSLDRNSYNSGDWFNALDYSYRTNRWAAGLPPGENQRYWPVMAPLLANPALKPTKRDIIATFSWFKELLRIRRSSRLFRLQAADEIARQVHFYNTGSEQIPGLLVMHISGSDRAGRYGADRDLLIAWNARKEDLAFMETALKGIPFTLHPILRASSDPLARLSRFDSRSGTMVIPGRTVAVFVAGGRASAPNLIAWLRAKYTSFLTQIAGFRRGEHDPSSSDVV